MGKWANGINGPMDQWVNAINGPMDQWVKPWTNANGSNPGQMPMGRMGYNLDDSLDKCQWTNGLVEWTNGPAATQANGLDGNAGQWTSGTSGTNGTNGLDGNGTNGLDGNGTNGLDGSRMAQNGLGSIGNGQMVESYWQWRQSL